MKKDKLWYRSRGLARMEERFGDRPIQKFLKKRASIEDKVRVLELGFGEGKCTLELRSLFPGKQFEFYGINDKKKGNMRKKSDFIENAKRFGIEIPSTNLPTPYFCDAGEDLKFKDNYFDAIISQVAFHYVGDKANLLEEMWRVLKPGGKAFLHIDVEPKENYPDFMKFNMQTPRFIIYENGRIKKLSYYINEIRKEGYDIKFSNAFNDEKQRILRFTKNRPKLDLGLEFDGNSTLYLTKLRSTDEFKTEAWWGTRSVYHVK